MASKRNFSEALEYHRAGRPGKTQIQPTKPTATQHDLSLAYSPGVAEPCLEIAARPDDAFLYTNRGNLVAVVTNGSAVLGLGNIGALASKPVMEGKAVLFKRFADIDVFDIELATDNQEDIVKACELLEPTFGGINLEDIKAPECFYVEETLKARLDIPVFHDDQHGTAIIAGAGMLNAVELTDRRVEDLRLVINGAGAAGIASANFMIALGVDPANILMCDSRGVIHEGREGKLNPYKAAFARETDARSLADALVGADMLLGVSVKDAVTPEMLAGMAPRPLVFALANPDPEIPYDVAKKARPDAIVATGRSDFPNQVNNVLGFPFLFRGALDVRARGINDGMKIAAARSLAALAKEPVPESVLHAYGLESLEFCDEYIIPKPFDPRVLWHVAPAVAEQAMQDGIARRPLEDPQGYRDQLQARFESSYGLRRGITVKAKRAPKEVVFPQGAEPRILRAARRMVDEQIAVPVILDSEARVQERSAQLRLETTGLRVVDPAADAARLDAYATAMADRRGRKGVTKTDAQRALSDPNVYAAMMLHEGHADAVLGGFNRYYAETLRPALQLLSLTPGRSVVSAVYIAVVGGVPYFLADCAVNPHPTAQALAEIALSTADLAREYDVQPHVALLSYSNFGSAKGEEVDRVREAVAICHKQAPKLSLDGEMHVDTALGHDLLRRRHPFGRLRKAANVLVFPNLTAANSVYKLLQALGGAELIGPILTGLSHSVHVIQRDAEVGDIVNLAAIAVLDAQRKSDS